jgi:hypothetical protein
MKKLLLLVLFSGLFLNLLSAQDEAPGSVIKTNPFGLAFGNFNLAYEKVLGESSSIIVKAKYTYKFLGLKVNVAGIGAGYRYYLSHAKKPAPGGFYINPEAAYNTGSSGDIKYGTFVLGGEIGYQIGSKKGVVFDIGVGPKYTTFFGSFDQLDFNGVDNAKASILLPGITVAVGYAF